MLLKDTLAPESTKPRVTCVVATVSPCSIDTEHSLNTMRTACAMAGGDTEPSDKAGFGMSERVVRTRLVHERLLPLSTPRCLVICDSAQASATLFRHLQPNSVACNRTCDGHALKMQVEVPLEPSGGNKVQVARQAHPRCWDRPDVLNWLSSAKRGRFRHCAAKLPSQASGKDICRWPVLRFRQLCGDDELGDQLFNALSKAKLAASSKQAAAVQASTASAIASRADAAMK